MAYCHQICSHFSISKISHFVWEKQKRVPWKMGILLASTFSCLKPMPSRQSASQISSKQREIIAVNWKCWNYKENNSTSMKQHCENIVKKSLNAARCINLRRKKSRFRSFKQAINLFAAVLQTSQVFEQLPKQLQQFGKSFSVKPSATTDSWSHRARSRAPIVQLRWCNSVRAVFGLFVCIDKPCGCSLAC